MEQVRQHIQTHKDVRPDHPVVVVSTRTYQTLQRTETDPHVLIVESRATRVWTAEKEFSAHTAGLQTTTQKYAESNITMLQAPPPITFQQDIIPQQHHNH